MNPNIPTKNVGDKLFHNEVNEIVNSIKTKADIGSSELLNISKIAHWDFSTLNYVDGTKISIVEDLSGFGNHMVNRVDTTQPTKQTTNNLSYVNFNGTQRLGNVSFGINTMVSSAQGVPFTIVVVFKASSNQVVEFPTIIKSGAATTPLNILFHSPAVDKIGSLYLAGNSLTSSIRGKSLLDDAWHIAVITFDSLASLTFIDGYLTNTQVTGDVLASKMLGPVLGETFTGGIGEVIFIDKRMDQNSIDKITKSLAVKWGITVTNDNVSNGPASTVNEDTTTPDGSTVRIWTPAKVINDPPLILYSHPQGQNEKVNTATYVFPLIHSAVSLGYYAAGSSMGTTSTPGGTGSSWGNDTAQTALLQLYNLVSSRKTFSKVILLGASMGGFASALAVIKNTIPNIKGVYFIDPALSLLSMYKLSTYTSTIDSGYGIVSGTLSNATSVGATSINCSISFPSGTSIMIDPNGVNPEQVITGTPSGSGPYTIPLQTALSFTHSSGVKISDYGSKTNGYDAMLLPIQNFNNLPVRFIASNTDVITVISNHTTPFKTKISQVAKESDIIIHGGGHLAGGAAQPDDFINFVKRVIQ